MDLLRSIVCDDEATKQFQIGEVRRPYYFVTYTYS